MVQYLTFRHEIMTALFLKLIQDGKDLPQFYASQLGGSVGTLYAGGSADVKLEDGVKSPDFSLYEEHPKEELVMKAWLTVIWEVGYSENAVDLAKDAARFVACSLRRVQLAIAVKIEHDCPEKASGQCCGPLKEVTCAFWEVYDVEEFTTLEEAGLPLRLLTRCDGVVDKGRTMPPAAQFSCVSEVEGGYVKFFVSQHDVYKV